MNIVLLGPPGAGKGTQASNICKRYHIIQISTGDMLRAAVSKGTQLGLRVEKIIADGGFASDEDIINLVKKKIAQKDCLSGFLLDGFPRTLTQAQALKNNNIKINFVIEMKVADDQIIKRLSGRRIHLKSGRSYHIIYNPPKIKDKDDITSEPIIKRADDNTTSILKRISIYHKQTTPLIDYYQKWMAQNKNAPRYICINGVGSLDSIKDNIFTKLNQFI